MASTPATGAIANVVVETQGDTSGVVKVTGGTTGPTGIDLVKPQQTAPTRGVREPAPAPRRVLPAPPRVPARDMREMFSGLANPAKLRQQVDFGDDEDAELSDSELGTGSGGSASEDGRSMGNVGDGDDMPEDANEPFEDELRPREGYRTLDEEKTDIIIQLDNLKRKIPGLRQFTVHNDVRDMRAELERAKTEEGMRASIRWQRQILMAIVNTLEYANREWNPRKLQLDGWGENVHESIDSYDDVFRELYMKYRSSMKMPPEVQLILMVGGSAMMFHFTNSYLKSPQINPAALQAMMQNMQNMQNATQPPSQPPPPSQNPQQYQYSQSQPQQPQQQQPQQQQPQQQQPQQQRRQMSGPGVDLGALLGGLPPTLPVMNFPVPTRSPQPMFAPQPPPVPTPPPPPPPPGSERLSDVVTEDLQSVPDDLHSVGSAIKEVTLSGEPSRKRGRKAATGANKRVVVI